MWQMVASQVVISPKQAGKGDNLWWPESKDEKYKGCGRCNEHLKGRRVDWGQTAPRGAEHRAALVLRRDASMAGGWRGAAELD